jgi:branched-chain amino acid transport system ATP-binding protein
LAPWVITQIFRILLELSASGVSILLLEQNVRLALKLGDHAYVLESGRVRLHGPAETIAGHASLAELFSSGSGAVTEQQVE